MMIAFIVFTGVMCIISAIIWVYFTVNYNAGLGFIVHITGILCGITGLLFRRDDLEYIYIAFSVSGSFIGFFVGRYLTYLFVTLNSETNDVLAVLQTDHIYNFSFFINHTFNNFNFLNLLWLVIVCLETLYISRMNYRIFDPEYTLSTNYAELRKKER